jgi:hypothetical protein
MILCINAVIALIVTTINNLEKLEKKPKHIPAFRLLKTSLLNSLYRSSYFVFFRLNTNEIGTPLKS